MDGAGAVGAGGHLQERLFQPGPKRILALDGGGIRGVLTAGILAAVEKRLAARSGRGADFRLCEYFDLIGGTSTGAIVAAALAMGKSTAEIAALYQRLAPEVFSPKGRNAGIRKPRFDARRLDEVLARELGDHTLGSTALRTGFAVFAKRIDTGSAWTLTNNPHTHYWHGPDGAFPNKHFLVRKLVQASAAAPTFFQECKIRLVQEGEDLADGVLAEGDFIDGAIAGLNNPSLQLLKVATINGYKFNWRTGADQLMMLSVGTGYWRPRLDAAALESMAFDDLAPTAARAIEALKSMIHDTSLQAVAVLQALSDAPRPWRINSEIGEMRDCMLPKEALLHFQRMDARLEAGDLAKLGLAYEAVELRLMRELASDDAATLARLHEIGLRVGESYFEDDDGSARNWEREILPPRFDPWAVHARPAPTPAPASRTSKLATLGQALSVLRRR